MNEPGDTPIKALRERLDLIWDQHMREHVQHEQAHGREHAFSQQAIEKAAELAKENKADANEWRGSMMDRELKFATKDDIISINTRLEAMTEFREQLNKLSLTLLTKEDFDRYHLDLQEKMEAALGRATEKYDAIVKSMINRQETDYNSIRESLQAEREIRKTFEGSVNTWKYIAGFLGISGIGGVILLFVTRAST